MRLFTKYNRVNIVASIGALLLGSVSYYFAVRYVLVSELDDHLRLEESEVLDFVHRRNALPEPATYRDQRIHFEDAERPVKRHFTQTYLPEGRKGKLEAYRELRFSVMTAGQWHTVFVDVSEEETEDLLMWIMLITAVMIGLLLSILFIANRLLLRRIWQPFYTTLNGIRAFNLSSRQPLPAQTTDIDEFRNLDEAIRQMTHTIIRDYEMLKGFADNASHEMQTPLAILNSKLDLLIQDTNLGQAHHRPILAMYDAISRLRQLNQSLLLLTKIENNQFGDTESVDLAPLIESKLQDLEDRVRNRRLAVHTELHPLTLPMNGYLADILLNNLLTNAIRHNQDGGEVNIRLSQRTLRVSNSGAALGFDAATIFDRFTKGAHSGGTGLGLAIVRQICDNYHFGLQYSFAEEVHTIDITFN
ncbi:MAG TPA: HAMP domain-containing sensor histidine kinase [Puia sp.]|uniref:sensor histidine kinase n=1 Tax=Puia sp. TaxID=2045100 RepID=UPI002C2B4F91|nr:HAMP domain-containing sensor histidine kinase [Puia sp.]HVU95583.1 HAMP domain-containing sensor histidine kinase [Puia sp.]